VEDRITPGLYLEMTDGSIDEYVANRVSKVLDAMGASRATWWRNVMRDRDDLPRVLPEFDHLAVYEVDASFSAPPPTAGVTGHLFHHAPRPGQGVVTGRPTIGLSLVLISPKDARQAQDLRDWADFVHIRHIAEVAVPGFCMITPYVNARGGDPLFMHFYEMDTDEPERAYKAMPGLVATRVGASGTDSYKRWAFHPALRIMYVNTFARIGERWATASGRT
jgi:hypothetical protein